MEQVVPFERNRYYYGKVLTSADFTAEQKYMNDKRWFLNAVTLGSGILCGLNVFNLDDFSLLVESGVALDPSGREIVVESSAVKRVDAMAGYHENGSGKFSLCLRFQETEVQPVYAVNRREDQLEYENNRIRECYELFLMEREQLKEEFCLDQEFFLEAVLRQSEDDLIRIRMPARACKGKKLKIQVEAEKLTSSGNGITFSCLLQLPVFLTREGKRSLTVNLREDGLKEGERAVHDYWVYTEQTELTMASVLVKKNPGSASSDTAVPKGEVELKVALTDELPETFIARELGKTSLEIRSSVKQGNYVRLADLDMVHTENAYIISNLKDESGRNYLAPPAYGQQRALYSSYYDTGEWEPPKQAAEGLKNQTEPGSGRQTDRRKEPEVASGTLEIPLEMRMRKGRICFSEEIVHGLGPGKVYVAVGINEVQDGVNLHGDTRCTVYGENALFAQQEPSSTWLKTAVKVWEEKGTFQVAAKLMGEQKTVLLSLHWTAIRAPQVTDAELLENMELMQITPKPAIARMRPREKYFFGVNFFHMAPCRVVYELTEEGSGSMEQDGTYTAPSKSGVYEIKIFCAETPVICTYAYAFVSREKENENE